MLLDIEGVWHSRKGNGSKDCGANSSADLNVGMASTEMKVLVVTWFSDFQTGYLDFSYRIKALSTRHAVTLITRAVVTREELLVDGCERVVVKTKNTSRVNLILYQLRIAALIQSKRPDIVLLLGSQVATLALLVPNIKTLVYWNEHPLHFTQGSSRNPMKRAFAWLLRAFVYAGARRARMVMPISEDMQEDLLSHNVEMKRVRLVYMGVDRSFAPKLEQSPSPHCGLRLVYAGSVAKARGRDIMLEGLALARRRAVPVSLILVGASEEQLRYCTDRASELGITDHVDIRGRVPGRQVPALLHSADAGICIWEDQPYWRFNPPTKLFEYLVAGLPVLASNIRTHTRYVCHGRNGFIFEYDSASFATAVSQLWACRHQVASLRRHASIASANYLWDNIKPVFLETVEAIGSA